MILLGGLPPTPQARPLFIHCHSCVQRLADPIEGSRAAKLARDSNNVVELIRDNYRDISSEVKMVAESEADDIKVKFFSRFYARGKQRPLVYAYYNTRASIHPR